VGATYDDVMTALGVFGVGLGFALLVVLFLGQLTAWLGVIRSYLGV
jgi:hypothetical protein